MCLTNWRNTLKFVEEVMRRLEDAALDVSLFGGWAEEMWGLIPPRPHGDIDLLLRAGDFARMDRFLSENPDLIEIPAKRFSHKRAFEATGVRVEVFLVRQDQKGYFTSFFDGELIYRWPPDVFDHISLASPTALRAYRESRAEIDGAYRRYVDKVERGQTG